MVRNSRIRDDDDDDDAVESGVHKYQFGNSTHTKCSTSKLTPLTSPFM